MTVARTLASRLARRACLALASHIPLPRVFYDRDGGSPYLSRWYLLGADRSDGGERQGGRVDGVLASLPVNLFLHRFHRSDDDGALHSHPWRWGVALVIFGGYSEERRVGDAVVRRLVLPFSVNVIRADDYHRVDLLEREAWTLFLAGPKAGTWYFWDRDTKMRAHWRAFIDWRRGLRPDAGWVEDRRERPAL